ncbi:MAG: hypothetical protein AAF693_20855 [Bacteroidota bacterium]
MSKLIAYNIRLINETMTTLKSNFFNKVYHTIKALNTDLFNQDDSILKKSASVP